MNTIENGGFLERHWDQNIFRNFSFWNGYRCKRIGKYGDRNWIWWIFNLNGWKKCDYVIQCIFFFLHLMSLFPWETPTKYVFGLLYWIKFSFDKKKKICFGFDFTSVIFLLWVLWWTCIARSKRCQVNVCKIQMRYPTVKSRVHRQFDIFSEFPLKYKRIICNYLVIEDKTASVAIYSMTTSSYFGFDANSLY